LPIGIAGFEVFMPLTVNWLQNSSYSAQLDRQFIEAVVPSEGVISPTSLKVSPQSPAALSVKIGKGGCFVKGDNSINQGMYYVDANDDENLAALSLPPSGYKRIDSVCVCVRDPDASGPAGNSANLVMIQGTQVLTSATASPPNLPDTHVRLANITLTSTTSAVTSSEIQNTRSLCGGLDHVGTIQQWAGDGSFLPNGWLVCQGQAVSRSSYPDLFEIIGTQYGPGDNTTTFNLPDLRSRLPMGAGQGAGLSSHSIGQKSGVESVTINTSQMPAHTHTANHDHGNVVTTSAGTHSHPIPSVVGVGSGTNPAGLGTFSIAGQRDYSTDPAGDHAHSVDLPEWSGNTGSSGGNASHDNMPPFSVVNFIIRVI